MASHIIPYSRSHAAPVFFFLDVVFSTQCVRALFQNCPILGLGFKSDYDLFKSDYDLWFRVRVG